MENDHWVLKVWDFCGFVFTVEWAQRGSLRGLKRLRKNSRIWVNYAKSIPPRLKPTLILRDLCGG